MIEQNRLEKLKLAGLKLLGLLGEQKDIAIFGYKDYVLRLEKGKSIIVARKSSVEKLLDFHIYGTYAGNDDKAIEYIKKIAR